MKTPSLEMLIAAWTPATLLQRKAALIALQSDSPATTGTSAEEILPRREAAKRFHRHPSFLDRAVRAGLIAPVKLTGRTRACGFRSSDIAKLMAGGEG